MDLCIGVYGVCVPVYIRKYIQPHMNMHVCYACKAISTPW